MTEPGTGGTLLDAIAAALRGRVGEQRRAHERRASFVFKEGERPLRGAAGSRVASGEARTAWSVHLARALGTAAEPATLELLVSLRQGSRPLAEAGGPGCAGGDPLAVEAWVGDAAAAGLVSHELETDRLELTPLGVAILDLLDEVAARAEHGMANDGSDPGELPEADR